MSSTSVPLNVAVAAWKNIFTASVMNEVIAMGNQHLGMPEKGILILAAMPNVAPSDATNYRLFVASINTAGNPPQATPSCITPEPHGATQLSALQPTFFFLSNDLPHPLALRCKLEPAAFQRVSLWYHDGTVWQPFGGPFRP
jgi:hypothetical protein